MSSGNFDPTEINLKRPIEASWKLAGWYIVAIPFFLGLIWGIGSGNIFQLLGVTGRRVFVGAVAESEPAATEFQQKMYGSDFKPGDVNRLNRDAGGRR